MIKKGTFLLIIFFFASCSSVPITGRKRVNFMSDSKVLPISFTQYKGFLEENTLSKNKKLNKGNSASRRGIVKNSFLSSS